MTMATALLLSLLAIGALVLALAGAIVLGHWSRGALARRRRRTIAPVRPLLLALLAEDDPARAHRLVQRLARLDARTWRALEPTVADLLGKLRGSAHDALRQLVERRGTVQRARNRARRVGAVGRARAAELLGGLENPAVTPDLVRLLHDRDPEVRQVAARALGRAGDPSAAPDLLGCLARDSVPPRVVAQALLRLGSGARESLISGLDASDELVRAVAVEILGLSSAVPAARAVETALGSDASMEVRIRAARALGRVGLPSAVRALVAATADGQPTPLRVVAARALGDLGHPDAVPTLRALLADPVHRLATNAARSLSVIGRPGIDALEQEAAVEPPTPSALRAREAVSRLRLLGGRPAERDPLATSTPRPAPRPVAAVGEGER